jgi:hypothetical protein
MGRLMTDAIVNSLPVEQLASVSIQEPAAFVMTTSKSCCAISVEEVWWRQSLPNTEQRAPP